MSHALIIDDNMAVGRAVIERLVTLGFSSFAHTWTQRQALQAAERHAPDVIVVGESFVGGSPLLLARRIAREHTCPLLVIDHGRARLLLNEPPEGVAAQVSFALHQICEVVASYMRPKSAPASVGGRVLMHR